MKRLLRISSHASSLNRISNFSSLGMLPEIPAECLKVVQPPSVQSTLTVNSFTEIFRAMSPYINVHRGTKVVIHLCGSLIESPLFPTTMADIALLNSFGIQLVLVASARPQVTRALEAKHIPNIIHKGWRVTNADVLAVAMEAAGYRL